MAPKVTGSSLSGDLPHHVSKTDLLSEQIQEQGGYEIGEGVKHCSSVLRPVFSFRVKMFQREANTRV